MKRAATQRKPRNIFEETVISLGEVSRYVGRDVPYSTARGWATTGVIGADGMKVYLETRRSGGQLFTSVEALKRFEAKVNGEVE